MLTPDQLEERQSGIGGSEAAVAVGLGKRMTPRELYHIKRGELDPPDYGLDDEAWIGDQLEPMLRKRYQLDTGRRIKLCGDTLRHPDFPFMLGHVDGLVYASAGFEAKVRFSTRGWGPSGTDQVPDDEYLQCAHYMAITGRARWDLQVVFAGAEFRRYEIHRDEALLANLVDAECGFWDHVVDGERPAIDFEHPSTPELVRRLYRVTDGRFLTVGVDVDPAVVHWHKVYREALDLAADYRDTADLARAHIEATMRTASRLMMPDGSMYERRRQRHAGGGTHVRLIFKPSPREA